MIQSGKLIRGGNAETDNKAIQDESYLRVSETHFYVRLDIGMRVTVERILQDWPPGCPREIHAFD